VEAAVRGPSKSLKEKILLIRLDYLVRDFEKKEMRGGPAGGEIQKRGLQEKMANLTEYLAEEESSMPEDLRLLTTPLPEGEGQCERLAPGSGLKTGRGEMSAFREGIA